MTKATWGLAGLAVAVMIGAVAALAVASAPERPASTVPAVAAPSPPPAASGERPAAVAPPVVPAHDASCEALRREVPFLRGQLYSFTGEPLAWPDELPTAFREAAWRERVAAVSAGLGSATHVDLDCAEYPCVVLVEADDPAAVDEVVASLGEGVEAARVVHSQMMGTNAEGVSVFRAAAAHLPPTWAEAGDRRLDYRLRTLRGGGTYR